MAIRHSRVSWGARVLKGFRARGILVLGHSRVSAEGTEVGTREF